MNIALTYDLLLALLLVMTRVVTFFVVAPPFAGAHFNMRVRAAAAFAIAVCVAPLLRPAIAAENWNSTGVFVGAIAFQVLAGLTLGMVVRILFAAFTTAGNYVDMTGGFAMAAMFDPVGGGTSAIIGRFTNLLATALLFTSGGHLVMLRGLLASFDLRMTKAPDYGALAEAMIHDFAVMIGSALQMAAPVLACLFLADLALGLVSRAVPSMNVFSLSFPIKIGLTLVLSGVFIAVFPARIAEMTGQVVSQFPALIDMIGGGG